MQELRRNAGVMCEIGHYPCIEELSVFNRLMRNMKRTLGFAAAISLVLATVTFAADAKFQADGSIQRMSGDMILVRTSAQDIEIKRNAQTKITGELRRGGAAKVYYMKVGGENVATEIVMGGATKPHRSM